MTDADLLDLARTAALAGGRAILPFVGRPVPADAKADGSPLTAADLAAHHAILAALAPSGLPVLSEESDAADLTGRARWTRFWCVDPLDGTKEFVAGRPEFTVNVALIDSLPRRVNPPGEPGPDLTRSGGGFPVLGVVHVPVSGVTYGGSAAGAWIETPGEPRRPLGGAPERTAVVVVCSRSHAGPAVDAILARIRADGHAVETAAMGSSLKFCLVADGTADLYPRTGPTNAWDTAAAQAVVEAAGGHVTAWDGSRLTVDPGATLNPPVVTWRGAAVGAAWPRWAGLDSGPTPGDA